MTPDTINTYLLQGVGVDYPGLPFTLALVSDHNGVQKCTGTGVLVTPGLALTAAHVVREWLKDDEHITSEGIVSFHVKAYQMVDGRLFSWQVIRMRPQWRSELAFLELAQPPWWGDGEGQSRTPVSKLSVKPPEVGTPIRVFGFPASVIEDRLLHVTLAESKANVRSPELRAAHGFRPLSYVELDGESKGGMSGGPCFDEDWNVVGIISTGGEVIDGPPYTTMALLWPVMSLSVDLFGNGLRPAWDIFKEGEVEVVGKELVHVTRDGISHIASFDPSTVRRSPGANVPEALQGMLTVAAENASRALIDVGAAATIDDARRLHESLRTFFSELESALHLTLTLSAVQLGVPLLPEEADWDMYWSRVQPALTHDTRDEVRLAAFDWNGRRLYELRAFANLGRRGVFAVLAARSRSASGEERVMATMLNPALQGGPQLTLPDGLRPYYEATRRFSQRLLRVTDKQRLGSN